MFLFRESRFFIGVRNSGNIVSFSLSLSQLLACRQSSFIAFYLNIQRNTLSSPPVVSKFIEEISFRTLVKKLRAKIKNLAFVCFGRSLR